MKKIALYPFNKINHGLIRFKDLLKYEIISVIDFTSYTGCDSGKIIGIGENNVRITDKIDEGLNGVDILILNDPGVPMEHFKGLYEKENLMKKWLELVERANSKNIEVILTHFRYDSKLYSEVKKRNLKLKILHEKRRESLEYIENYKYIENRIKKIGVFGTGPVSGKFTAQFNLYRELKQEKKITAIVTEPTGFLFDLYQVPLNYELNYTELAQYITSLVNNCEKDGHEYVIMAGQAGIGVGNQSDNNYLDVNFLAMTYLRGFMPDKIALVVGYDDDEIIDKCFKIMQVYAGIDKPDVLLISDRVEISYGEYMIKSEVEKKNRILDLKKKYNIEHVEEIKNIKRIKNVLL